LQIDIACELARMSDCFPPNMFPDMLPCDFQLEEDKDGVRVPMIDTREGRLTLGQE